MILSWIDAFSQAVGNLVGDAQTWLFVSIVQPLLYRLDMMSLSDLAYDASFWFVAGAVQITVVFLVLRPLEIWRPLERWPDRKGVRVDVIYTLTRAARARCLCPSGARVSDLFDRARLCRLLVSPLAASVPVVVGTAFRAP
ncbi:MAG: hypothetical protein P8Y78_07600 [Acidihalobacter sp.]